MSRPQDQYLFKFTVTVLFRPRSGEVVNEKYDDICCIIETKTGGLVLHDRNANVVAMYAPGNWHQVTTSDVQPVPPTAALFESASKQA